MKHSFHGAPKPRSGTRAGRLGAMILFSVCLIFLLGCVLLPNMQEVTDRRNFEAAPPRVRGPSGPLSMIGAG